MITEGAVTSEHDSKTQSVQPSDTSLQAMLAQIMHTVHQSVSRVVIQ